MGSIGLTERPGQGMLVAAVIGVATAGVVAVVVLATGTGGALGPPGVLAAVAVSACLLSAFPFSWIDGPERHSISAVELAVVVALIGLPPSGVLLAAGVGMATGYWLGPRLHHDARHRSQAARTVRFAGSLAADVAGLSVAAGVVAATGGGGLTRRIAIAGGATLAMTVVVLVLLAWLVSLAGAGSPGSWIRHGQPTHVLVSAAAAASGVPVAVLGARVGGTGWWLLGATVIAVAVTTAYSRSDADRRRLRGLLEAATDLHAATSTREVEQVVVAHASHLAHAPAALRIAVPAPNEHGVPLPDDPGGRYLMVDASGDRAVSAGDREALTALASVAVVALRNVALQEELAARAVRDELTGLANRWVVAETGRRMLASARRNGTAVAAVFVDVDGLKTVNDRLGHATGDALLVAVADRLRSRARAGDVVARIGGDEFVVLAPVVDVVAAEELAAAHRDRLHDPFPCADGLPAAASVGVACWSADGPGVGGACDDIDALLAAADQAMYRNKLVRRSTGSRGLRS